jgi:hypothetical protein
MISPFHTPLYGQYIASIVAVSPYVTGIFAHYDGANTIIYAGLNVWASVYVNGERNETTDLGIGYGGTAREKTWRSEKWRFFDGTFE